jgi:hypothetical protein
MGEVYLTEGAWLGLVTVNQHCLEQFDPRPGKQCRIYSANTNRQ